ncbi:MAG: SIS domain-containing protein [Myxococcota bacterium]|nr:SIS domain-containing protein [Myxococcota bacterium]
MGPIESDWMVGRVRDHLLQSLQVKQALIDRCLDQILAAALLITETFQNRGKLLLCGNGGSAADCQHLAAEFVSRLTSDFERPALPAIALTTDTSFLTAYSNDVGFVGVFERQVRALGRPGDLLIGISTSGTSQNIVLAAAAARYMGLQVLCLCGEGGVLPGMSDRAIQVPSAKTQYIQEAHLAIEHILCDISERLLFATEMGTQARHENCAAR